jgi:hypothetical protein
MLVNFLNGTSRQIENLSGADLSHASLYGENLSRENLSYAYLYGADLYGANLSGTNLSGANLTHANLSHANMSRANMSRANLSCANLHGAVLSDANLCRARFSYVLLMSSIQWGRVSNKLCLEMMRRDALITGVEATSKWAKGGSCPFLSLSETRAYYFYENRKLWRKGKPQMTDRELWVALCKEKNIKI